MRTAALHTDDHALFGQADYEYVLAANGLFLAKQNPAFRAIIPVTPEAVGLQPVTPVLELQPGIRLSAALVCQAVTFCRHVRAAHGTEAVLWLRLNPATGALRLDCPRQENGPGSVSATEEPVEGWRTIGTIHSHPCHSFHSSGDRKDEARSDGLHLVVGSLDQPSPDFTATLVVNGRRQPLAIADVLDNPFTFDQDWLRHINAGGTQ